MATLSSAIAIVLMVAALGDAHAQRRGAATPPPAPADISEADCEKLAALPSSPISVETCKAMLGMRSGLDAAATTPGAQRPGDDTMTCAQIFDEFKTMADVGISEANTAKSEAVVREGTALANRQAGVMTAFMVETYALGAAMGAVSAFTPNFVGAAITAAWQARVMALAANAQAEQAVVNVRVNDAMAAGTEDLMRSMQSNPRFGRLMQLAMAKECQPPASATR